MPVFTIYGNTITFVVNVQLTLLNVLWVLFMNNNKNSSSSQSDHMKMTDISSIN